jgi:hypothetical protein
VQPDLKLTDLFRFPTVRALSAFLAAGAPAAAAHAGLSRAAARLERRATRLL